jgi:hypothetical protein
MGLVVSLILIAVGAILTWGINSTSQDINVDAIGVILMIIGLVGLVLTMLFWQSWLGSGMWRRRAYAAPAAAPVAPAAAAPVAPAVQSYVVEEEVPGPPAGGPPPPP